MHLWRIRCRKYIRYQLMQITKWLKNSKQSKNSYRIKLLRQNSIVYCWGCFSGTLMRTGNINTKETIDQKYIERLKKKKTRLVITSGEMSLLLIAGGNHSLFALKLIDTLKNNNSVINSQILFENIRRYVVANADQTQNELWSINWDDGGDFVFPIE